MSADAAVEPAALAASEQIVERFADGLWLEDGLAPNTTAAYRRDLMLYARWLAQQHRRGLLESTETDLLGYIAARHGGTRPTTANRRLTVFKRFFRWALREHQVAADPTLRIASAKQPLRVPKTLSEAQVEALLRAPDVDTPLGLRDRAMLELMYASGLRVSELVMLKSVHVEPQRRRAARDGQGRQGAAGAVRCRGRGVAAALSRQRACRNPRPAHRAMCCSSPRAAPA